MATTGELRAIIELLELVDIGDAASYLGEEGFVEDDCLESAHDNDEASCATCATVSLTL